MIPSHLLSHPLSQRIASRRPRIPQTGLSSVQFAVFRHHAVGILFFTAYFLVGWSIFKVYGLSWDEPSRIEIGRINYEYIIGMNDNLLTSVDRYHGPIFDLVLLGICKIGGIEKLPDVYYARHWINFLTFFVGLCFFYLLLHRRWGSWKWALLGCSFLIVSPRIFADAFYNSKDLPFLSGFIIAIYTMLRFLDHKTWGNAALHALVCGFLTGIRIPGIILPVLTLVFR